MKFMIKVQNQMRAYERRTDTLCQDTLDWLKMREEECSERAKKKEKPTIRKQAITEKKPI
jgi:hypothetical protein